MRLLYYDSQVWNSLNTKILLAPVLAIILALLIAGAVSPLWPRNQPDSNQVSPTGATVPPTAALASAADIYFLPLTILFIVAIGIVGLAVVLLFFREKNVHTA